MVPTMTDAKRVVVVGASSGLGRCIAADLAGRGWAVAALGRRADWLASLAEETGGRAVPTVCDVTMEASVRAAVAAAASHLGGIDALVYCPGIGPLRRLEDTDQTSWRQVLDTNVVGASLVTAAALRHLEATHGVAVFLSSSSASITPPWPGLGAYAASKAALDKLVDAWRGEHPEVGFTRVVVGECAGGEGPAMTGFAQQWDPALAAELGTVWVRRNLITDRLVDVDDVVQVVRSVLDLSSGATIPAVTVLPRGTPTTLAPDPAPAAAGSEPG